MKKQLILLGVLLCSQLSMAEDLAPNRTKIIAQNSRVAWVKFRDNSDGDFFRFYFDGKPNRAVRGDVRDTTSRNGKSRVVPFRLSRLAPKTYKVSIGVIKDNKEVVRSEPFDLTIGKKPESNNAPTIAKVFKGSERYTWVKFVDHSDGDLFRFYFNGKENLEAIKDYNDTTAKNGKSRVVPINMTKLAPNSKFDVTIGVIKDGKKIAESKAFTIETGDDVELEKKVIEFNKENSPHGGEYYSHDINIKFFLDNHLAQITYGGPHGFEDEHFLSFYRIDDNNNVKDIPAIATTLSEELSPHFSINTELYADNKKLKITSSNAHFETQECAYYDIKDLDNIQSIGEKTVVQAYGFNGNSCSDEYR